MSGRTKETHSFKVFPFLAVLICTMGSLIFLLLVTTLKIRQREAEFAASERAFRRLEIAEAEKSAEVSEPVAEPEPPKVIVRSVPKPTPKQVAPLDDGYELALAERNRELTDLKTKWRSRADQLASERDQRLRVLTLRRQQNQESLEKTESLKSGILQLENNLGELAGEAAAETDPKEDTERVLVEQQILQMKRRLRAAQVADATEQNDQFQVVPFDPQTGTTRRPIFIECSAAGIRFLPEDILITAKDLEGFTTKANPIAAGTGALINYWNAINLKQRNPRSEPEPYVLILVRPEGVVAYYVALRMLEPIRTSQGYELIEESTVLKLPDVDSGAKTACQTAVSRLFAERENIARSALMTGSGGSVFGGAPGRRGVGGGGPGGRGQGGGGTGNSGSGNGGPGGGPGGGPMFGSVRGSGPGGTDDSGQPGGNGFTMNDLTGGDNSVGSRSWERVENFQGRPRGQSRGNEVAGAFGGESGGSYGSSGSGPRRGTGSGADTGNGDGFDGGAGDGISRGSYAGTRGRSGGGASGSPGGENEDGAEEESAGGTAGGTSGGSGGRLADGASGGLAGGSGGGTVGGSVGGTGQGSGTSDRGNSRMAQGSGNRSSGGNGSGNANGTTYKGSVSGGAGSGQFSEGWDEPEPGMPIGQRPNRKSAKSKPGSDGESGGPEGDSDGDGPYAQGTGGSSSRSGGQSSSSRLSDTGSSSPRFSHNKGSSTRAPHPGERPSKKNNDDADKPLEPEMLAGRRWGFCEPGASIGFEREVRVDVSEDKLMIAEKFAVPIGQGESRQETLELFATALDAYSHEWGRPPQGFFWAPRLKFIVKPEGNGHYEQVNAMMTRAGLATSHEFSKQNETIEFGRDTASTTKPAKKPALKAASSPKAGANR